MIRRERIRSVLLDLLAIPSPSGFTDEIVHYVSRALREMRVDHELTRRGTIRARIPGKHPAPARAIVTHLDTLGAMVSGARDDGRVEVAPIGRWSSRFAEGARVTVFSGKKAYRGTLLPAVEWGVSHDKGIESVPLDWRSIELRLDEPVYNAADVHELGIEPGNFVALNSEPELFDNGYIVGRSLDNKAGSAAVLEMLRHMREEAITLPHDMYVLFTITETIGAGMGGAVLPEVSELVTVDFASVKSGEKSPFKRVTIASGDASGPYDFHLNAHLRAIAEQAEVPYQQRHLKAFHSDAAAALVAGHDVRTAVIAYAGDASHSIERTHIESLLNMTRLLEAYSLSEPTFSKDESVKTAADFSHQIDSENLPEVADVPDVVSVLRATSEDQSHDDE